ncbi:hypothetical protein ABZ860_29860 [Microbispora sp. NPDC046973]|uniref:DedA family protein n=1 Tax=Microbispora sp. NPDC046973 TaxID=3155022 RepID=UPI0034007D0F
MTEWLIHLMEMLGAPGAGIAIALENLFPPLPSEVILPLAGFTASRGEMDLVAAPCPRGWSACRWASSRC